MYCVSYLTRTPEQLSALIMVCSVDYRGVALQICRAAEEEVEFSFDCTM